MGGVQLRRRRRRNTPFVVCTKYCARNTVRSRYPKRYRAVRYVLKKARVENIQAFAESEMAANLEPYTRNLCNLQGLGILPTILYGVLRTR